MQKVHVLTNGITVVLDRMDAIRSVSVGVFVKVGSVHETKGNNGISHMLEHMFFKGTNTRTVRMLADDMARIGGNVNAYTSKECTAFYATTIDVHLEEAIKLFSDMLLHSLFLEEECEKEKEVILDEIDMYEDSAEDLVHDKLQQSVWKDHPLGHPISGVKQTVGGFTSKQLFSFKDRFYHGSRMVISVSGRMEEERVLGWLNEYFGGVPAGEPESKMEQARYHKNGYQKDMDIEQVHLNIAFEAVGSLSEERYAVSLANAVLGGNDNSHLFQKIREKRGMAYSIYSYFNHFLRGGLLHIDAVLNPSKLSAVYEEIFQVIKELVNGGVLEDEIEMAKEQFKIETLIAMESTKNRMSQFGLQMLNHGRLYGHEETIRRMERVTRDEVQGVFERYLIKENSSLALVGKEGTGLR